MTCPDPHILQLPGGRHGPPRHSPVASRDSALSATAGGATPGSGARGAATDHRPNAAGAGRHGATACANPAQRRHVGIDVLSVLAVGIASAASFVLVASGGIPAAVCACSGRAGDACGRTGPGGSGLPGASPCIASAQGTCVPAGGRNRPVSLR